MKDDDSQKPTSTEPERTDPVHAALHFLLAEHKIHKPDHVALAGELQDGLDGKFLKNNKRAAKPADNDPSQTT